MPLPQAAISTMFCAVSEEMMSMREGRGVAVRDSGVGRVGVWLGPAVESAGVAVRDSAVGKAGAWLGLADESVGAAGLVSSQANTKTTSSVNRRGVNFLDM